MIETSGYTLSEIIYESSKTIVYRGRRDRDSLPIVIKLLKKNYPTLEEITRLRQEYALRQKINSDRIVKAYKLETYHNSFFLVLEDFGGCSLKQYLQDEAIDLNTFFQFAIAITESLQAVHESGLIHKDIKPSNIIINPETQTLKLTDFSIAIDLPQQRQVSVDPSLLEGTLAYISPEQTGRMNRNLDYRSDFYSLGVTFYEMLAGRLPFMTHDSIELVHCHIAKSALPLQQLGLPLGVAHVVSKLLAKNAEDRYQSVEGLKFDLEYCQQKWQETGEILEFPLGSRDRGNQLLIPQKLYGREAEVETLLATFNRLAHPAEPEQKQRSELILVSGYSGIGKTSIVNEVHKPIVEARGYFIAGKFDQFKRNIPYAAIVQAFQELVRQLLAESEQNVSQWRAEIIEALGTNAQIIIDVIPEVELIIGLQPEVAAVGPIEAQNRFNRVFEKFVRVFAKASHPLVVFLDDLQWADSASLKLIQLLVTAETNQHLLLIGAYRDNEVSQTHPLIQTLENIQNAKVNVNNIVVKPLGLDCVIQLIADTLNSSGSAEKIKILATLIFNKTQGNPFFLTQFLKTLYAENVLNYDAQANCWNWEIREIQAQAITDYNVVELIAHNISKLAPETQTILKLAACIGNQFNLDVLAIVGEDTILTTANYLQEALQIGLILPIDEAYKIPLVFAADELSKLRDVRVDYRFLHDRVQQAAYSLIPEDRKRETHFKIGSLLWQKMSDREQEENIFALVNQLNFGTELLEERSQKDKLAKLNLKAGQKAKANAAYEAAFQYLETGLSILPSQKWESHYDLTLDLYRESIEAAYLNTEFNQAIVLAHEALDRINSLLDRVCIYELKIKLSMAQGKLEAAFNTGMEALELLDIHLVNTLPDDLVVEQLIDLPELRDPKILAVMRILTTIQPAAFILNNGSALSIISTAISLAQQYGNSPAVIYLYATQGWLLCGPLNDIKLGNQYGKLAFDLLEKFHAVALKAKAFSSYYASMFFWENPIRETFDPLEEAVQSGLETGDIEFACHAAIFYCEHPFLAGEYLVNVVQRQERYIALIQQCEQEYQLNYANICGQLVLNLQGKTESLLELKGERCNETEMLPLFLAANNINSAFYIYFAKAFLAYLFRDNDRALANVALAEPYTMPVSALLVFSEYLWIHALALLAVETAEQNLEKVAQYQAKIETWAQHAPMNYQHKYDLIEAEKQRVFGNSLEAMEYYDRAIAAAKANAFTQHEAIANEIAGEFYLAINRTKAARAYFIDAYYAYIRWGAIAKVKDLEKRYPHWFNRINAETQQSLDKITTITTTSTSDNGSKLLDLPTILKASQALSEEIVLNQLLQKLLKIALENAGADKGILLLPPLVSDGAEAQQWRIQIAGIVAGESIEILDSLPPNHSDILPLSIINYVQRVRESLVLDNASQDDRFAQDRYILNHQPRSVLCAPILNKGQLKSILYLENHQTASVFSRDRLEILQLLAAQAAISIENAQLYENLEQMVQTRTQELSLALTNLQDTQSQLVESEKMAALGNLVAGVAHEINTPLGIGITAASALADRATTFFDIYKSGQIKRSQLEKFVDFALQSSSMVLSNLNRAAELVQSFKQVAVDQSSEAKRAFELKEYIHECLIPLRPRLKRIPHQIEIIGDDDLILDTYPGALSQIITNLVMNSLIHAYEPGETAYLRINFYLDGQFVILTYIDDGCGIPADHLDRIFEPFFTTKRGQGGTGLGLHLVYNIATQQLKGSIECSSEVGVGTTFVLRLPVRLD
jgi:predicted ATPase/signal transduction histidine kinase/tRNA A-37 threonylcarbamoyl transferase component Bud32